VAIPVRYLVYAGGIFAILLAQRRLKKTRSKETADRVQESVLRAFVGQVGELQRGLRALLLSPPDAEREAALGPPLCAFLAALDGVLLRSRYARDPRAVHYATKIRALFTAQELERLKRADEGSAQITLSLAQRTPEARRRLWTLHEALLDLLDFLQVETGVPQDRRADVFALSIDPAQLDL
jgi:hypothetical protein